MRKLMLVLLFAISCNDAVFAQIGELDEKTTLSNNLNMILNDPGVDDYKVTLANLALFMFNADRVMNGSMSFVKPIQLAATATASLERGLSFNNGKLSTSIGGVVSPYLTANEIYAAISDSGYTVNDTSTYAKVHRTNIFDARNEFWSLVKFMNIADFGSASKVILPNGDSLPVNNDFPGRIFILTSGVERPYITNSNGSWLGLALHSEIASGGVSGWTSDTDQSGLGGLKTLTSGGIKPTGTADTYINLYPVSQSPAVHVDGLLHGNLSNGFHELSLMTKTNQGQEDVIAKFPETAKVESLIDERLKFGEPVPHNTTSDTLDFASSDPIAGKFGSQFLQTIYLKNYQPNFIVSCFVQSGEGVTFDFGSVNIKWLNGILPPAFDDQKIWTVAFQYFNPTTVLGSFGYYE